MIDEIVSFADKLDKIFAAFKINLIAGTIINLIIIIVLFKLTDIFTNKLKEKFKSNNSPLPIDHIVPLISKIVKFLIAFILIASFLQSQGYSLTSLIAGFGITGLAVSFAAQQTISSIFGTIALLGDKVYKIGDYVKINDLEGTVEAISIRSTKIRSLDNFVVTVPNDMVANSIISNVSGAKKRRIDVIFGLTYDTTDEKLKRAIEIINEAAVANHDIHKDFNTFMHELDSSSINIRFIGYAKTRSYDTFVKIKGAFLHDVTSRFRKEGIDFAFPSQTVYMAKNEN